MNTKVGKCLCGGVHFVAESIEIHHHACHCGMCRRWAGGPVLAASVKSVTFTGEENVIRYRSSAWAERGFCKICGSNLFYYLEPAQQYMICVGAFDDSSEFQLAREIYIDHQPAGYAFAGNHERLTEAEILAQFATSPSNGET